MSERVLDYDSFACDSREQRSYRLPPGEAGSMPRAALRPVPQEARGENCVLSQECEKSLIAASRLPPINKFPR